MKVSTMLRLEDWGIGGLEDWGIGGLKDWGIGTGLTGFTGLGLSHAEAKCARAAGVGLPERSEPEGPQGAARGRERRGYWGVVTSLEE